METKNRLPVRCWTMFDFKPSITYENNLFAGYKSYLLE